MAETSWRLPTVAGFSNEAVSIEAYRHGQRLTCQLSSSLQISHSTTSRSRLLKKEAKAGGTVTELTEYSSLLCPMQLYLFWTLFTGYIKQTLVRVSGESPSDAAKALPDIERHVWGKKRPFTMVVCRVILRRPQSHRLCKYPALSSTTSPLCSKRKPYSQLFILLAKNHVPLFVAEFISEIGEGGSDRPIQADISMRRSWAQPEVSFFHNFDHVPCLSIPLQTGEMRPPNLVRRTHRSVHKWRLSWFNA